MESTPLSGMRWVAAVAACGLTACVGAFPQAPAGLGEDAEVTADTSVLAGSTPSDAPRSDAPPPASPPPVTAAPTLAGEPCTPGLCRECDPDGSAHAPLADPDCPPLDCSELTNGRLETNGRQAICLLTTYVPGLDGRCEGVGRCAVPAVNAQNCARQADFEAGSVDQACADFADCPGGDAQIVTRAQGTPCVDLATNQPSTCDGFGRCLDAPRPPPPPVSEPPPPPPPPEEPDLNCGQEGAVEAAGLIGAQICGQAEVNERVVCRYRFADLAVFRDATCTDVCTTIGERIRQRAFQCVTAWSIDWNATCESNRGAEVGCESHLDHMFCDCRP